MLGETKPELLIDASGRPYFMWDCDVSLTELRERIIDPDRSVRGYWIGKTMRQAKPEDALALVPAREMHQQWSDVEPYLGHSRAFWHWLLFEQWNL